MNGEPQFDSRTYLAIKAVMAGASEIMRQIDVSQVITHSFKADNTLVLNVDLALQEEILKVLEGHPIVSEEMPDTHPLIIQNADYFVVDPLDGTTSCKRFFTAVNTQVGFGPIVGVVERGHLIATAFFNCPARTLFVAERGKGCWVQPVSNSVDSGIVQSQFQKLQVEFPSLLRECGVLFYVGMQGEFQAIEKLKSKDCVENFYRFGGFANDCSRLARGFEQIQIQYAVKAWDLPAVLLAAEVGCSVRVGIGNKQKDLSDWNIADQNPVCVAPPQFIDEVIRIIG